MGEGENKPEKPQSIATGVDTLRYMKRVKTELTEVGGVLILTGL